MWIHNREFALSISLSVFDLSVYNLMNFQSWFYLWTYILFNFYLYFIGQIIGWGWREVWYNLGDVDFLWGFWKNELFIMYLHLYTTSSTSGLGWKFLDLEYYIHCTNWCLVSEYQQLQYFLSPQGFCRNVCHLWNWPLLYIKMLLLYNFDFIILLV